MSENGEELTTESSRRAWLILAIASASTFLFVLEAGFLSVAFPSIEEEFSGEERSLLAWVSIIYFATGSPALLVGASFGDKWGRSRVFVVGLVLFAVGAAVTALAPTVLFLLGARAVEGIGGGLLRPTPLRRSVQVRPQAHRMRPTLRLLILVGSLGTREAQASATSLRSFGWRWVFALLAPGALGAAILGWRMLPNTRIESRSELDVVGLAAVAVAIASLAALVSLGNRWGWASPRSLGLLAGIGGAVAVYSTAAKRRPGAVLFVIGAILIGFRRVPVRFVDHERCAPSCE